MAQPETETNYPITQNQTERKTERKNSEKLQKKKKKEFQFYLFYNTNNIWNTLIQV